MTTLICSWIFDLNDREFENAYHTLFMYENVMISIRLTKIKIMFLLRRKIQKIEIEQKYFSKNV